MTALLDSSVLVAAVVDAEPHHEKCLTLLDRRGLHANPHALAETFSTLTGSRRPYRISPDYAAQIIEITLLPCLSLTVLTGRDIIRAMREARNRGIRGGAIYDYLHLATARKAGASGLYTLNVSHFLAFRRPGDPDIVHP